MRSFFFKHDNSFIPWGEALAVWTRLEGTWRNKHAEPTPHLPCSFPKSSGSSFFISAEGGVAPPTRGSTTGAWLVSEVFVSFIPLLMLHVVGSSDGFSAISNSNYK